MRSPAAAASRSPCYAEATIAAPPAAVMAALRDVAAYESWRCPFTERMDVKRAVTAATPLAPGDLVTEHVRLAPGDAGRRLTVVRVTESGDARLVWDSVIVSRCLLHATRTQTVAALEGGAGTLYTSEDAMTGLLAPLVLALYGARVRAGFEAVAAALKRHVGAERVEFLLHQITAGALRQLHAGH